MNKKMPVHIFSRWNKIIGKIRESFLYFMLDYDGTLSPIVRNPYLAAMPKKTKSLITDLAALEYCKAALISGRALSDIKKRAGIPGIVYAGNHGFEISGPKIKFKYHLSAEYVSNLKKIKSGLKEKLAPIKGVIIEDKKFSLSVHYRAVDQLDVPLVESLFYEVVIAYEVRDDIRVKPGKMLFEVRPPVNWDKGKVVSWLIAREKSGNRRAINKVLPLYIGDDVTDEDAFRAIAAKGITVHVGKSRDTAAQYYLKGPAEVRELLARILKELKVCRI